MGSASLTFNTGTVVACDVVIDLVVGLDINVVGFLLDIDLRLGIGVVAGMGGNVALDGSPKLGELVTLVEPGVFSFLRLVGLDLIFFFVVGLVEIGRSLLSEYCRISGC